MNSESKDYLAKVEADLPPGTTFLYLNSPCIVLRYAGEAEQEHTGVYGMVYEYTDRTGVIHRNVCAPRDLPAMLTAIHRIETPAMRGHPRWEKPNP